ncbi:unnamed protein product, partial [Brassica rapa subsp. trilocularis]
MGSRSQSEDQSTFDPNYTPPNTVDFATQEVLATLAAAAEAGDQIASQEAGVTRADGKQQGSRKGLSVLLMILMIPMLKSVNQPKKPSLADRPWSLEQPAASRNVMLHSFCVQPAGRLVRACA